MAYQRVPETVEVTTHFTMAGVSIVNTYHAEKPGGYAQGDIDSVASAVDVQMGNLRADLSSRISYVRTDVRGLDSEFDITSTDNSNAGVGGQAGSVALPPNVAFCVTKLSGLTGRSARGRVYIAGIPAGFRESGAGLENTLTTVAAAAYAAHVDAVRIAIENIGGWNAVIVSRYHEGSKRAEGVTFPWTTSQYADRILDTRRNRAG